MTIEREGKKIPVEENGYLSDESDFYGPHPFLPSPILTLD